MPFVSNLNKSIYSRIKEGDLIAEGDVTLVLESMKMQMLMRALIGGTVRFIHLTLGSQLAKGDLMVKIEE